MPQSKSLLSLAAAVSTANAAFQGFNYGATFADGSLKVESDFETQFTTAQNLEGTNGGFNSARLFTMIQGNTPNDPISAIPAAIKTKTSLLFGLWASGGEAAFGSEIEALTKTIDQYCDQLDGLVAGISVGSEDLYRNSETGQANGENPGANPDVIVDYIARTREAIQGSCLSDIAVGHVDTWTAYDNSSNSAVIEACDWLGMDAYAYFEDTKPNGIENGKSLFEEALARTEAAAGGKEVWITETGWPVSGEPFGEAVPSPENAQKFYEEVGCPRFGSSNIWWYILEDTTAQLSSASFGVVDIDTKEPRFDLSCDGSSDDGPDASSSASKSDEPAPTASHTETASGEPLPTATQLPTTAIVDPIPSSDPPGVEPVPLPTPLPTNDYCNSTFISHPHPSPSKTVVIPEPLPTPGQPDTPEQPGTPEQPSTPEQPETPGSPGTTAPVPTDGQGTPSPSEVPEAAGTRVNSLGAAVVAMVVAVGIL